MLLCLLLLRKIIPWDTMWNRLLLLLSLLLGSVLSDKQVIGQSIDDVAEEGVKLCKSIACLMDLN